MKKLSIINEGMWTSSLKRSKGEESRKEDEIKSVDLGLSVLWSTEDLEINGQDVFTWKEIHDYNNNGWRLPTQKECDELLHSCDDKGLIKNTIKINYPNGENIVLNCLPDKYKCKYWESNYEKWKTGPVGGYFTLAKSGPFISFSAHQYSYINVDEKFRVRLVKEKERK